MNFIGSVLRNYCTKCGKFYDAEFVFSSKGIPKCECGGTIKPDVVLYEEALDEKTVEDAILAISNADTYFRGKNLVLITRDSTPFDNRADLVINESLGNVFSNI